MQDDSEEKCVAQMEEHSSEFRKFIEKEFPLAESAYNLEMQYKKVCALLTYVVAKHGNGRIEVGREDVETLSSIKSLSISHPEEGNLCILETITDLH